MKVLHVCEAWRPVTTGNTTRSWERLRAQAGVGGCGIGVGVAVTSRHGCYPSGGEPERPDWLAWLTAVPPSGREARRRKLRPFYLDEVHHADAIEAAARAFSADVVHAHWSDAIGNAAATAARNLNLPFVAEVRFDLAGGVFSEGALRHLPIGKGLGERLLRRHNERHLKHADHVVAASHTLGRLVAREFPATADKLTVIPNGLDADRYTDGPPPDHLVQRLGLTDKLVVGTTGTMYRYEGLDDLIHAAAALRPDVPDLHLLFVGGGPQRPALEALAKRLDVPATFHGPVGRDEMPGIYRLFDLFVVPRRDVSITRYAAPIKLTEAMAAGTCCVGSACGDVPELLANGRGVVVPPDDMAALTAAIRDLAGDEMKRLNHGRLARTWATDALTWAGGAAQDAAIYGALT